MSDSKFVKANKKIAEKVVKGHKAIEKGVVDGYKKIEEGVVGGYKKVEDKFVDKFLKKDGETIEEAKTRLKAEEEKRKAENLGLIPREMVIMQEDSLAELEDKLQKLGANIKIEKVV